MKNTKVRLCMDFNSPEEMSEFVDELRKGYHVDPTVQVYTLAKGDCSPRKGGVGRTRTGILLPEDKGRERMTYLKKTII